MTNPSTQLPKEPTARKLRADAIAVLAMGVVATGSTIAIAAERLFRLFTPEGIVWRVPVEHAAASAQGLQLPSREGSTAPTTVAGTLTELQVVVSNVNTVSTVFLGTSIVVAAIAVIVAILSIVRLAWLFQQGRFFTMATSLALRVFTWTSIFGGLVAYGLWFMGENGVEAALGASTRVGNDLQWWGGYWILLFAVTSSGLIDVALRRAMRLQHETEGLI